MSVTDQIRIYRWMHHVNWSEKSIIRSTAWRCWGSHKYLIFVCKGCLIYLVPGLFVFLCRWFLSPKMIPTRPPCWVSRLYTVCMYVVQTLSWEREFYVWTIENWTGLIADCSNLFSYPCIRARRLFCLMFCLRQLCCILILRKIIAMCCLSLWAFFDI